MIYIIAIALVGVGLLVRFILTTPSRQYQSSESVSDIYDQWTKDKIVEFYWGDHLHVGYYGNPPIKKDFIIAKNDLIEEMIKWGIAEPFPRLFQSLESSDTLSYADRVKILDVGCGIGGTVRHLANRWPNTVHVSGITISGAQAKRAVQLNQDKNIDNAVYFTSDARKLGFASASFDIVWALESEPHILDKEQFINELVRVLKPGGALIIGAWNVRDSRQNPLSKTETEDIQYLLGEWNHAKFISINEYVELFGQCGLSHVTSADWSLPTLPSWVEGIREPFRKPIGLLRAIPFQVWGLLRDAYTLLRLDAAFRYGLCQYGLIRGQKAELK